MKEQWIEAFRIGGAASRHIKPEHLAEVVDDDFEANPRALCFGHPKSDDPAAGTIAGAKVEGNSLMIKLGQLTDKAIDGIKSGAWLNRSAAFFDPSHEANPRPGKWTLRHVGLLGGSAPGIPNMTPLKTSLAFEADDDGEILITTGDPADALVYAAAATPVHYVFDAKEPSMTEKTPEQLATEFKAREDALELREKQAAERIRNSFEAGNSSTVDALVEAGKVLPAEAADLKAVFNAFDPEGDELTFGAGDKATKATASARLGAFLTAALGKRVPVGGRQSPSEEFDAANEFTTPAALTAAATALAKDKGISFDAAYEQLAEKQQG